MVSNQFTQHILFPEERPTAPLRVCITGTTVHDFKNDRICVAGFANFVVCAIVLGPDKLEALSTRQIIVKTTRQGRPELHGKETTSVRHRTASRMERRSARGMGTIHVWSPYLCVIITIWCREISSHREVGTGRVLTKARVRQTKRIASVANRLPYPAVGSIPVGA